jgi:ATP-dependent Clp protease adapter protein ClpS
MNSQPRDPASLPPDAGNRKDRRPSLLPCRGGALPAYRLILLNNPAQELMYIVRTIMELTRLCRMEATHKMWEAHHTGRSHLLLTYRERGELYVEQFSGKGIHVTIEPA